MRRGFWIVLLAIGTVVGFGAGFARLCGYGPFGYGPFGYGHGHGYFGHDMHGTWGPAGERLEDRAADACVRAAERVLAERKAAPTPAPAPAPVPGASAL
jgi:hypothetical protein